MVYTQCSHMIGSQIRFPEKQTPRKKSDSKRLIIDCSSYYRLWRGGKRAKSGYKGEEVGLQCSLEEGLNRPNREC